jgi:hypothetical protein
MIINDIRIEVGFACGFIRLDLVGTRRETFHITIKNNYRYRVAAQQPNSIWVYRA